MNSNNYQYLKNDQGKLQYANFEFCPPQISDRRIILPYRLSGGIEPDIVFNETLTLPEQLPLPNPADPVVQSLLSGVHRAFGVSYFKAAIPPQVIAEPVTLEDAAFWNLLYGTGMGEFWYRNNLNPQIHAPRFPDGATTSISEVAKPSEERVLILVGGGKDSVVAREVVRQAGVAADAISLGTSFWQQRSAQMMGLRHLVIDRQIDTQLFALNRQGAWNGHIPISACIAFITTLVAYIGGYSAVIAANERSANESNLSWHGISINHQWSKSFEFEQQFNAWRQRHLQGGGPHYFSLLRTLGELRIAEAFARHSQYFADFASCNANFRHQLSSAPPRWCGHCPKCVFVQLILAPFFDEAIVQNIFGGDFLANPDNLPIIEELVGISGVKPFECVGTHEESLAALAKLHSLGRLRQHLPHWYSERIAPMISNADQLWEKARAIYGEHQIPTLWQERLNAYL